jgi:AcrR family transcriptional regulator
MSPDERRSAIVAATLPLLLEHGPDISTRDIARAAGVAEGTIFRAFDTKHDLIHATIHTALTPDDAISRICGLPADQSLRDRVSAIMEVLHDEIHRTRSLFAHLARPSSAPGPSRPERPPFGGVRPPFNPHETKARLNTAVAAALQPYSAQLAVPTAFASQLLSALAFASSFTLADDEPLSNPVELADVVLHGIAKGDS